MGLPFSFSSLSPLASFALGTVLLLLPLLYLCPSFPQGFLHLLPPVLFWQFFGQVVSTALQSLTGSLQGRFTYREIHVVIAGNRFAEYTFFLFWSHSFPCFINIQNAASIPVMCTGNCPIILQGLKGCFNPPVLYTVAFQATFWKGNLAIWSIWAVIKDF